MDTQTTQKLVEMATKNVHDIVTLAIEHADQKSMLVVYDLESDLSQVLTSAYQASFTEAQFVKFDEDKKEEVLNAFANLSAGDLVVLVQSADFRLSEFRIRLHLFDRDIKVVDHRHLNRNTPDSYETYIGALSYDPEWYRGVGHVLKDKLSATTKLEIMCGDQVLTVENGLEEAKPNLGDYREMKNTGGAFPIGEVFTEAKDLTSVNGSLMIYSFADVNFNIEMREPHRYWLTENLFLKMEHTWSNLGVAGIVIKSYI